MARTVGGAALLLGCLAVAACAHAPTPHHARGNGLAAVERWTAALYPYQEGFRERTWWIGQAARDSLDRILIAEDSMPQPGPDASEPERGEAPRMTDTVAYVLSACAAHRFVPLILRRLEEPAWHEAAAALDAGRELPLDRGAQIPRATLNVFIEAYGNTETVFARLRGEKAKRPPAVEEIAAGLLLTADVTMQQIGNRAMVDPGMAWGPAYENLADVPLTLAPLYALSVGVDPLLVEREMQTCWAGIGDAQYKTEPRVRSWSESRSAR